MQRTIVACIAALALAIPCVASGETIATRIVPLALHASAPERFVPIDWSLSEIRTGDLNHDGLSDAVLMMQRRDDENIRRLAVVFGNPSGGFNLVAENNELLNGTPEGEFRPYPSPSGIKIRRGNFAVSMVRDGPGGTAIVTFTFRYQNDHFALIGYDYKGIHRGWINLSYNFLTGQVVQIEGDTYAGNVDVIEGRYKGRFSPPKSMTLDSLGNAFAFEYNFSSLHHLLHRPE